VPFALLLSIPYFGGFIASFASIVSAAAGCLAAASIAAGSCPKSFK
jgi:hypothetical protein